MVNIDELKVEYFENYIPVKYDLKCGNSINIYPVSVENIRKMEDFRLFTIEKNEINDIDIIKMSYLQFLNERYFVSFPEEKEKFLTAMSICLGCERKQLEFAYISQKICLVILDNEDFIISAITKGEFDDISKIILFQNIFDYDDEYVSKDVRTEIERYFKYHSSKDVHNPTLEEKKIYLYAKKQMTMKEINQMPYRLFAQTYNILFECEQYLANKIIQASEKYKVERDVHHPMIDVKETIYDKVFGSLDEAKSKITQANN